MAAKIAELFASQVPIAVYTILENRYIFRHTFPELPRVKKPCATGFARRHSLYEPEYP